MYIKQVDIIMYELRRKIAKKLKITLKKRQKKALFKQVKTYLKARL